MSYPHELVQVILDFISGKMMRKARKELTYREKLSEALGKARKELPYRKTLIEALGGVGEEECLVRFPNGNRVSREFALFAPIEVLEEAAKKGKKDE